jgi:hypothetical protein
LPKVPAKDLPGSVPSSAISATAPIIFFVFTRLLLV